MARSNAGCSTTGEPKVPYYRQSDRIEVAKYLRLTVTRYLADRASLKDIEEAMVMLRAASPVVGEHGHHATSTAEVEPAEYECKTCIGQRQIRDGETGDLRKCLDCNGTGRAL